MTESMERVGISRRSFIGGVGITAGAEFDTFTATRTRSDGLGWRRRSAK